MSVDTKRYESAATKRARALADMKMCSSHEIKRARQEIRSLADEVDPVAGLDRRSTSGLLTK